MAKWLLQQGHAVDPVGGAGITPLMVAAEANAPEVVSLLLEHGADSSAVSQAGCTSLHYAASAG